MHRLEWINELFLPLSRQLVLLQGTIHAWAEDVRQLRVESNRKDPVMGFSRMVRDLSPYLIQKKFQAIQEFIDKKNLVYETEPLQELKQHLIKAESQFERARQSIEGTAFDEFYRELATQMKLLSKAVDKQSEQVTSEAQSEGKDTLLSSVILSVLLSVLGILMLVLSRRALAPLPLLIDSIKKGAETNFSNIAKVRLQGTDELSTLAREYNLMLDALADRDSKINKQQQELLQSERLAAIGQLSGEIVHEIRNPLNSISLNIEWLQEEVGTVNPAVNKTVHSISKEVQRLNQITESYLVRARVPVESSGRTNIQELIDEILDFEKDRYTASGILIERSGWEAPLVISGDRSRLKQAFINILQNAREAMPRGGKISIRTSVEENIYKIEFADTGHGMNSAVKRKTFQPFFSTKPSGTGLGLLITKNIIEEAQGSIHCNSHLGEGTNFTVQFPV